MNAAKTYMNLVLLYLEKTAKQAISEPIVDTLVSNGLIYPEEAESMLAYLAN